MRIKHHLIVVFSILSLNSCLGGDVDVREYVDDIKKTSVGKISELPPEKTYTTQEFTAQNIRSPFDNISPIVSVADDTQVKTANRQLPRPDAERRKQYLEQFPLSDLTMVGSLSKENYTWGLIKDKNGMVHAVKLGDYLGQNSGVVKAITVEEIDIVETITDGHGGWKDSEATLRLNAE